MVEHTHVVKNQIQTVQINLIEAENSQRAYLLTKKELYLQPLKQTQKEILSEIGTLKKLTDDNPSQQGIIKKLRETVSKRYQILYATIKNYSDGDTTEFLSSADSGRLVMQEFMAIAKSMDEEENKLLIARKESQKLSELAAPKYLV